jgi:hypothetical protein
VADPLFTDRALQESYRARMTQRGNGDHVSDATWERIASGEIDPAGRDAAFDHVVQCEACSRVWRGLLDLKSEAEAQGLVAAPAASSWFRSPLAALAVAASVILVAGLIVLRPSQTPVAPAPSAPIPATVPTAAPAYLQAFRLSKADIHVAPEEALAPRGTTALAGEPSLDRLAAALEPYRRDDYAAAVPSLEALHREFPTAGRPGLYLGVSLLHLDRDADALAPLSVAVTSTIPAVSADARWYRAIAYARNGQGDAAAADVKILCDAGAADSARACNAMQALASAPR